MAYKLLVINPGSTSTKVSYFENEKNVFTESIFHDAPELLKYPTTNDQLPMRRQVLLDFLKEHGIDPKQIDVFVGRGGCAYSQQAGVMTIDEKLVEDTAADCGGSDHPAKLGVMLAYEPVPDLRRQNVHRKPHQCGRALRLCPAHGYCGAVPPGPDPCAQSEGHCGHPRKEAGQGV